MYLEWFPKYSCSSIQLALPTVPLQLRRFQSLYDPLCALPECLESQSFIGLTNRPAGWYRARQDEGRGWHLHSLLDVYLHLSNIKHQAEKISKQKPSLHQTVLHSTCFWSLIKRWTGADLVLFRSVPADDEKILLKITDWRLLMNLWAFVWRLRQNVVWLVFFCKLLMTWPSFIPPVSWLRLRPELVNTIKHMRGLSSPRSATKVMDDGWFSN